METLAENGSAMRILRAGENTGELKEWRTGIELS
jgi:hypothetical protein